MKILAISGVGYHDASAAIVCDGELVAAAEEERFTRKKHDAAPPLQAAAYCLRQAGVSIDDIDLLAIPELPYRIGPDSNLSGLPWGTFVAMARHARIGPKSLLAKSAMDLARLAGITLEDRFMDPHPARVLEAFRATFGRVPPIRYFGHHHSHAASTFFTSGETEAAVVTIDGGGGSFATATWHGQGTRLRRTGVTGLHNSLGNFYSAATEYVGLGEFGEGKLMGLAPYGDPERCAALVARLLELPAGSPYRQRGEADQRRLGFPPRDRKEDILRAPYPDFAAAVQSRLEAAVDRVAAEAMSAAGTRVLCGAGGVMLNCSMNGHLATSGIAERVWVFPAPGDAGMTVGAALLAAAEVGELVPRRLADAYLGPAFTPAECAAAVEGRAELEVHRPEDLAGDVAERLAAGQVVGRFQGRMEFGPRALGNRSILADPRTVQIRDRVNRIKRRELWRPLAPLVAAEEAVKYFELTQASPFMLFAYQVRPEVRTTIAGVVHCDGSARPQTVERERHPELRKLLDAFAARTGVPVLLNTSFNDAGEPIVCSPQDAVRTFLTTDLDVLVLEDLVMTKRAGTGKAP